MKHRVEAHQCPVHRWTTEIHRDRCGVRDASGARCGERFAASYTFLPTHEHDEALSDLRGRHWKERHPASPAPPVVGEEGWDLREVRVLVHQDNLRRWVKCDALRVEPLGDGRHALRTVAYDAEEARDTELVPPQNPEETGSR
jgi:hypothetical protein